MLFDIFSFCAKFFFPLCNFRAVKIPAVEKAVKKIASRWSTRGKKLDDITPDETPEDTPRVGGAGDVNEKDVKPLVVQKEFPTTKDGDPKLAVEIEKLVIYPARDKLQTARRGKPFHQGNPPGCKRAVPVPVKRKCDDVNTQDIVDDASVEVDKTSYEMWLASEGLASPKPNIRKINEDENKQDVKEHEDDKPIPKKVYEKDDLNRKPVAPVKAVLPKVVKDKDKDDAVHKNKDEKISVKSGKKETLAQIKSKVKGMISHGEEVELSEAKLNRLKAILSLLDEDDEKKNKMKYVKNKKKKKERKRQRRRHKGRNRKLLMRKIKRLKKLCYRKLQRKRIS